jgi:hypothetical protein
MGNFPGIKMCNPVWSCPASTYALTPHQRGDNIVAGQLLDYVASTNTSIYCREFLLPKEGKL